jgi:cellulose synthase/poly-beta-1,6-N-acetylglucosamine synthase-like glycosyltransferase
MRGAARRGEEVMSEPWAGIGRWTVLSLYFGSLLVMTAYGCHRWYLIWLYLRHRRAAARPPARFSELPRLTVQLPLFNEMYVARRLIEAVCALDYPRDRLEIQVLDDSTDETTRVVAEVVERYRRTGFDIVHLHRTDRAGFKAGALEAGLKQARGDLVAIFDADFVPEPGFARNLVHHFTDAQVGMVQARWGHLNPHHSALTRVQSMLLDGHFVIEHTARNRSGRFFNFNGTAGMWRRECIADAGGWQHDTLTEDLDLSYRAQLRGWKFVFLTDEVSPAELPIEMGAFKSQQHRWAKGSIQTARKLLPTILRSDLPLRVKAEATVHLTANVGYVMMVVLALLVIPSVWLRATVSPWLVAAVDLPLFAGSTISVVAFYFVAQREALGTWRGILRWVPFLMAVGVGLSINNGRAVMEALAGRQSSFRRTPKYNLASGERLATRRYRVTVNRDTWIELALAVWFTVGTTAIIAAGMWAAVPFLLLFQIGYAYTAISTLLQSSHRYRGHSAFSSNT